MKRSWFWLLSLLLIVPHLAVAQQTDIYGNSTTVSPSTPLSISPDFTTLYAGEQEIFTASGGSGQYTWEFSQGRLSKTEGSSVTYTAPLCAGCDAFVTVFDDSGNSDRAEIKVLPPIGLLITPGTVKLSPCAEREFKVTNAEGPISWTTSSGNIIDKGIVDNAYTAIYTVPETEGEYEVFATEIMNPARIGTAFITAFGSCIGDELVGEITPENVILPPGGEHKFRLSAGDNGNIQWTTTGGYISEHGEYTAPEAIGDYEVKAYFDVAGNYRTAYVTVADVPVVTPKNSSVGINGETTLEVKGGVPPYQWTATDNSCSITRDSGKSVTYRCSQSGEMTITVSDNIGQNSEAKIHVNLPLKPNPENLYVIPGQTEKVGVTGGLPPYTWKPDKGKIDDLFLKKTDERVYSAPPVLGNDVITITDSNNASVEIKVRILLPLSVTPQELLIKPAETQTISVVSGTPPYNAKVTKGVIQPSSGNQFSFTADSKEGKDIITICDQVIDDNGRQRCQFVKVFVQRNMNLANLPELVEINSQHKLTVIGGTGGYFGSAEQGNIDINPETGIGTYTAPDFTIQDTITINDNSDNPPVVRTIEVVGYMPPVISPNAIISAEPGETLTFSVSRGEPPYEWNFEGSAVATIDEEGRRVEITVPQKIGTYLLTVTDAKTNLSLTDGKLSGKPATAVINVYQPLKLTPETPTVYRGEYAKLRINKLGGIGKCEWSSNSLQEESSGGIIKKADDYVVVKPRTEVDFGTQYQVTCRDSVTFEEASSIITVAQLQNDQNSDGLIDDNEASTSIDQFFDGDAGMNKTMLYLHLELFILTMTQ